MLYFTFNQEGVKMKRKLEINEALKMQLREMRDILAGVDPSDPGDLSQPLGCGGTCYVTCSYWCETYCMGSCLQSGESRMGCGYKFVDPFPPTD